ncbi:nucleoside diphosphate kinase homolog 7 [Halyomorpha halys]|uniref:nucleoside diphosphate kinase homolog 7 n=1 Tax=Halyomorpha halys TaxID=286706 RepID=UPI0006D51BA8
MPLSQISTTDKYSFHCEWFDTKASLLRRFYLFYFPSDGTIELYDKQRKKKFLNRISVEDISLNDIYVGNTVKVFNRQIKITGYANEYTKRNMGEAMQKVFVLLKPDGIENKSHIIKAIISNGFKISNLRMMRLSTEIIEMIFPAMKGTQEFLNLLNFLKSGPVIAMELICENAVQRFQELAGPEDPKDAKDLAPQSLRSLYGVDLVHNIFHIADISESERLNNYFFGSNPPPSSSETSTVVLKDSTCCVIKPHAVRNGHLGEIMCMIEHEGYSITALQMFYIDNVNAEEFFEVYRGVLQEYPEMVSELISGACLAMEITGMGEKTPKYFRNLVGPSDPEMARQLRPNTLRAIFGENKIKNAMHVTDLPEDSILEVEYFFKILI